MTNKEPLTPEQKEEKIISYIRKVDFTKVPDKVYFLIKKVVKEFCLNYPQKPKVQDAKEENIESQKA